MDGLFRPKPFNLKKPGEIDVTPGGIVAPGGGKVETAMNLKDSANIITNGCKCDRPKCECLLKAARGMMIGAAQLVEAGKIHKEKADRLEGTLVQIKGNVSCLQSADCNNGFCGHCLAKAALPKTGQA